MRICFVSREVAGVRGGGIGTYVAEAGKALTAAGHEVWLLIEHPGPDKEHLLRELPGFHRVVPVGQGVPPERQPELFHGYPEYRYSSLVHETLQALGQRFDYIEFPDYGAEGYVTLREQTQFGTYDPAVVVVTIHTPMWECITWDGQAHRVGLQQRELCNLEDETLRIAPFVNAPSRVFSDEVKRRLGLPQDIALVRYPMESDPTLPDPPRPRERLEDLRFLYYGRIEPRKGIEQLLAAFARLPELSIDLIGGDVPHSPYGGSYRDWMKRRAPANVRFVDPMPRPELLKRITQADVCVLPSLLENYPNTCIEAMLAGRVVLGSLHGGMSEMIEHGVSGFHVDGRSPDDIVHVITDELAAALPRLDRIGLAAATRMRALCAPARYVETIEARVEQCRGRQPTRPPFEPESRKVSIVIPFYKDRAWIDEAVDSALAQTHRNLEVLIVNDGSPLEDAAEILARQAGKDARVEVLNKPNGGLGSARNHAIERATGDYLLFLDADNVAGPEYASTGVRVLEQDPEAAFMVGHVRFFQHETRATLGHYNPLPYDRRTALLVNRFGDAGAFFRRSVFLEHGLRYDELLISYEDWALWMDLDRLGQRGQYVTRTLYDYRVRGDSMLSVDGTPNHPALMGLLIERHFTQVPPEQRDILSTLFQVAGHPDLYVTLGGPRRPSQTGSVQGKPPLRYKLVDEVSRISRKVPGLNRLMRSTLGGLFRLGRGQRG